VNVLFNDIGTEQAQALANVLKEHATLKSLCGNKGNETELDMSGKTFKRLGAEGAIMLAPEIADNGALTSLDISDNKLACGAYNGRGDPSSDANYATDTTGMCVFVATKPFSDAMLLQVLLFLPMPSVTTGRYRRLSSVATPIAMHQLVGTL
jgi:hypothetical protein